jgi:hypothetical protein
VHDLPHYPDQCRSTSRKLANAAGRELHCLPYRSYFQPLLFPSACCHLRSRTSISLNSFAAMQTRVLLSGSSRLAYTLTVPPYLNFLYEL